MSEKTTVNREAVLRIASLVRPALATQDYIPALQHIRFDGNTAVAYNDIAAIEVVCADLGLNGCLPGDTLIRMLNSFKATDVGLAMGKEDDVILSSGRSRLKVPVLGIDKHPYEAPSTRGADSIDLDSSILKGIERCLLAVGNDPTHPAQMGVTLEVDDEGNAVLWATDNYTISRYQTEDAIKLPNDEPVILPIFFCQQLLSLAKSFPGEEITLYMLDGAVCAKFGKVASLLHKTLVDLEPLDFPRIFTKHCGKLGALLKTMFPIPDAWEGAFGRALLVLSDLDKISKLTITEPDLRLSTSSDRGDSDDRLPYDGNVSEDAPESVFLDPSLVLRVSKVCTQMAFNERALALADADGSYIHLIAYSAK